MKSKGFKALYIVFSFVVLFFGVGCAVQSRVDYQVGQVILRSKVEEAFSDLESAYASKNIDALTAFLDKDFEAASWFGSSTENYLLSVSNPRIHFIIDAVLTDKNGITVRFHWFKKGTVSGVETKSQGASLFVFKKYPEALRIVSIRGENPFF